MFAGKLTDKKEVDNVEVYISSSDTNFDFKNPLIGVSAFEISSIELANQLYNVPDSIVIETSSGMGIVASGSYTSSGIAAEIQRALNLVAPTPFVVSFSPITKKITIANVSEFYIYNVFAWPVSFRRLLGFDGNQLTDPSYLGPTFSLTFGGISDDTVNLGIKIVSKPLLATVPKINIDVGNGLINNIYIDVLPIDNKYGEQKIYCGERSKLIKFKERMNISHVDFSLSNMIGNSIYNGSYSMTFVFYF